MPLCRERPDVCVQHVPRDRAYLTAGWMLVCNFARPLKQRENTLKSCLLVSLQVSKPLYCDARRDLRMQLRGGVSVIIGWRPWLCSPTLKKGRAEQIPSRVRREEFAPRL